MINKALLYKKLNALRLEVDGSIVDDIMTTVDDLFFQQNLQQTVCTTHVCEHKEKRRIYENCQCTECGELFIE